MDDWTDINFTIVLSIGVGLNFVIKWAGAHGGRGARAYNGGLGAKPPQLGPGAELLVKGTGVRGRSAP